MLRRFHSLPALAAGLFLSLIAASGAVLSVQPALDHAAAARAEASIGAVAARIKAAQPGLRRLTRSPDGLLTAQVRGGAGPQMLTVDPVTGAAQPIAGESPAMRWIKGFHRSLRLGEGGRLAVGLMAAVMALLAGSGLWLLARALGGWRRLGGPVRAAGARGWHARIGRAAMAGLGLSALTGAWMSAATLGLVPDGTAPTLAPLTAAGPAQALDAMPALDLPLAALRELRLPARPGEPLVLDAAGRVTQIDPASGTVLAAAPHGAGVRLWDWAYLLHTGHGAWWLGLLLGVSAAAVPALAGTGLMVWAARRRMRVPGNVPMAEADLVILVGTEGGTTRGFAAALHRAATGAGQRVHLGDMNDAGPMPRARALVLMAATWGDGAAPASAARFLDRLAGLAPIPVAVLGFGDRMFPAFCGYAARVQTALAAAGFAQLIPPGTVDRQSPADFAAWARAFGRALGLDIAPEHRPALPRRHALRVLSRRDYGQAVAAPSVILRLSVRPWWLGGPRFQPGDLLGVMAPGATAPRFYSLASASADGFAEIAVRRLPGGACSPWLHGLHPGARLRAFVRRNPAFRAGDRPTVMIATGCGVAPMAGLLRRAAPGVDRSLYLGLRDLDSDFLYAPELTRWRRDGRLTRLIPAVSRGAAPRHVQDRLREDAAALRRQIAAGARVLVCGSLAMGRAVAAEMDALLAPAGLSVARLKQEGRYVEDIY